MYRFVPALTLSALALFAAMPALGADYPDGFRPAYPENFDDYEPLGFEVGLRYWYSKGEQSLGFAGETVKANDTSHILEGHLRIDDRSTSSYVKGQAGYAFATDGSYSDSSSAASLDFSGGQIGYAGADFGYMPFGTDTFKFGGLIGYQYMKESPDKARADFGADGLNIHALRLGVTARAEINDFFDINAELAAIPYADISGQTANYLIPTTVIGGINADTLSASLSGAGYGAAGEVMLGIHPTENMVLRVGGRGWMLKGPATASVTYSDSATPGTTVKASQVLDGLSLFRYGLLAELTGKF